MKDNEGALLITFIIFLTLVGILASSIGYLLQNVPYAIKSINSVEQSYYLSESGLRYVLTKIKQGQDYNTLKDAYEYGNREIQIPKEVGRNPQTDDFAGSISLKFNKGVLQKRRDMFIHSHAQVDTESFIETKRQLNAEYKDPNDFRIEFEEKHFDQNASDRDRIWNLSETFYANIDTIKSIPSLQLKSEQQRSWVLASLNWGKNDKLPDLRLYQYIITKVLSYKIQIKINCYPVYGQKSKDFMAGLNFRVMNATNFGRERVAYYGISLFKSAGRKQGNPPCWLVPDSNDCKQHLGESFLFEGEDEICQTDSGTQCLVPNAPYVIFWVKTERNENIELLAFCDLRTINDAEDNLIKKLKPLEWGFKDWLNIGIFLKEKESAGQKINEAQIGLRATDKEINWTFPIKLRFVKASANDPGSTTTLNDRTLVSKDLSIVNQTPPDEIGFHALYDNRIISSFYKYNIYYKDFLLDCHGEYCPEKSDKLYVQF